MRLDNLDYIKIQDRTYPIERLNAIECMEWGLQTMSIFGFMIESVMQSTDEKKPSSFNLEDFKNLEAEISSADMQKTRNIISRLLLSMKDLQYREASKMLNQALGRCYTPENESLSDTVVYNRWFRQYPGDHLYLAIKALFALVAGFLTKPLVFGDDLHALMNSAETTQ